MWDYNSLEDMTADVDLVVRGRITGVYVGEMWRFNDFEPPAPHIYASVELTEVLKGLPLSRIPGAIEVTLAVVGFEFDVDALQIPSEEYLWFLRHDAGWRAEIGKPPVQSAIAPFAYFRPNFHQTVLRNEGGAIGIIRKNDVVNAYGNRIFPLGLEGRTFANTLADVRSAVIAAPDVEN